VVELDVMAAYHEMGAEVRRMQKRVAAQRRELARLNRLVQVQDQLLGLPPPPEPGREGKRSEQEAEADDLLTAVERADD
jgi:hypothetical protein